MSPITQGDYTLDDLLRSLGRGLVYALPAACLAALATYLIALGLEPRFEAGTTVIAVQEGGSGRGALNPTPPLSADAYKAVVESDALLLSTFGRLETSGIDVGVVNQSRLEAARDAINVRVTEDTRFRLANLFDIFYQSPDPVFAAAFANSLSEELVAWDASRAREDIDRTVRTLENQLDALDEEIASLRLMSDLSSQEELESRLVLRVQQQQELSYARALRSSASGLLSVIQPAAVPTSPVAPRPLRYAALAFLSVTVLGLAGWLVFNALDPRVRGASDVAAVSGLPVLADFGAARGPGAAELLRTQLFLGEPVSSSRSILLSSPAGDPPVSVATALAKSYADLGQRVLLAAPLGSKSGAALTLIELNSAGAAKMVMDELASWTEAYDLVLIAAPAVLESADALTLAPLCDVSLLTVEIGSTGRNDIRRAAEWLSAASKRSCAVIQPRKDAAKTEQKRKSAALRPTS